MKSRKLFVSVLAIAVVVFSAIGLSACKKHVHEFSKTEVYTEATCLGEGVKLKICDCGAKETEKIAALGHDKNLKAAQEATCTESGYTAYTVCSRCGLEEGKKEVKAKGHAYYTEGVYKGLCSVCHHNNGQHTVCVWEDYKVVEETVSCLKAGIEEATCLCGKKNQREFYIQHTADDQADAIMTVAAVEPTCSTFGWNKYTYCSICGADDTWGNIIKPKKEHKYVDGRCVLAGCGIREPKEHECVWEQEILEQVTCVKYGEMKFTCSICGDVYKKAIESSGHKFETVQKSVETCQAMGCEQDYIRCTTCKDTFGYIEIPVDSEKHNIEIIEAKVANCIEIGWNKHYGCTVEGCAHKCDATCNHVDNIDATLIYTEVAIDSTNHSLVKKEKKDATCKDNGWTAHEVCEREGCSYTNVYTVIEASPDKHVLKFYDGKEATCSSIGWKEYFECEVEGCTYSTFEQISLNESNHNVQDGYCVNCQRRESQGLKFELLADGTYAVTGMGTCDDTNVIIPAKYRNSNVTAILAEAFKGNTAITGVMISNNVKTIGASAFEGCTALKSVFIPASVTTIEANAFKDTNALETATFANKMWLTIGAENPIDLSKADNNAKLLNSDYVDKKWTLAK